MSRSHPITVPTQIEYRRVWSDLTLGQKKIIQAILFTLTVFIISIWAIPSFHKKMNVSLSSSFRLSHLTTLLSVALFSLILYGIGRKRPFEIPQKGEAQPLTMREVSLSSKRESEIEQERVSIELEDKRRERREESPVVESPPVIPVVELPPKKEAIAGSVALEKWYLSVGKETVAKAATADASVFFTSLKEDQGLKENDTLVTLYRLTCGRMKSVDTGGAAVAFSLMKWLIQEESLSPDTHMKVGGGSLLFEIEEYLPISIREKVVTTLLEEGASVEEGGRSPLGQVMEWGRKKPKDTFRGFKEPQGFEDKIPIIRLLIKHKAKASLSVNSLLDAQSEGTRYICFNEPREGDPGIRYGVASIQLVEELLASGAQFHKSSADKIVHRAIYVYLGHPLLPPPDDPMGPCPTSELMYPGRQGDAPASAQSAFPIFARALAHLDRKEFYDAQNEEMNSHIRQKLPKEVITVINGYASLDLLFTQEPPGLTGDMARYLKGFEEIYGHDPQLKLWTA